uniref:Centrosomal protein 128 n=1 Tax=Hippocampus comes TaxID=109280 RepID=A0A3Q2YDA0_HIPCM
MDTSSGSDSSDRLRGHRWQGLEAHRKPVRERGQASGRAGDGRAADISEKISTLCSTLQDTNRNLTKVDQMLGQYREHTNDQAEAMALVKHLFNPFPVLQSCAIADGKPTSPLKDYAGTPGMRRRRRSHSASVRFKNSSYSGEDIHTLHQSMRDLRCDQQRLSLAELRAQLRRGSASSEVEELKNAVDRKESERIQLRIQLEVCASCLFRKQSVWCLMSTHLSFQSRGTRSREELRAKAQKAVRQWRAKCNRLQKELEEARAHIQLHTDKAAKVSQGQAFALSQQAEAARRELAESLQRLAQREEELHRKDVALSESRQCQLAREQEIREVRVERPFPSILSEQAKDSENLARLREENQRLIEQADTQTRLSQRHLNKQAELQVALSQMTSAHAQLAHRLSEAEASKKELQKVTAELQAKLAAVEDEPDTLRKQLQLEREVHRKELDNLKVAVEGGRTKREEMQDMLRLCRQQRDEIQSHLNDVKAAAVSETNLCEVLRVKLDRMKDECDKLAAQLNSKEDAHALLCKKYQLLKLELDEVSAIRLLREEVREHDTREQRLRLQHKHTRAELKALRQTRGTERDAFLQRLDEQEKLLLCISTEKQGTKSQHCYCFSVRSLLLANSRAAMDYVKLIPETCYMTDNFKDLEESQRQKEAAEQCYAKHKEIVWDLQHQLDESRRKIHECREEKLDATSRRMKLAVLASSMKSPNVFFGSPLRSDTLCEFCFYFSHLRMLINDTKKVFISF